MIQNRKRCSKAGKDVQKLSIFRQFCPKKCAKRCKSAIAHRTPIKGPHAHTSRTLYRMVFAQRFLHAHVHVRPHIARVRAGTHLRNSYLGLIYKGVLTTKPLEDKELVIFLHLHFEKETDFEKETPFEKEILAI